jgi:hypothetical protein
MAFVVLHRVDALAAHDAPDDHHGHDLAGGDDAAGAQAGADEDHAVDAVLEHDVDGVLLAGGPAGAGGEQRPVPVVVGGGSDAVVDVGEERVVEIVQQHADGAGAPAGEMAGRGVAPVAELGGGVEHELATPVADVGAFVHHERHEGARNPGPAGDVLHRRVPHVPLLDMANGDGEDTTDQLERSTSGG